MFAETLKKLRRTKKISQVALAEHLGITQQAVGKWETGRSQPDPQTLRSLADYFDVTTDYLLGRAGRAPVVGYAAAGEHPIPVVGTVRAGFGALALEEDCGVEYARVKDPENYFYLIVRGNSMEPVLPDGATVAVNTADTTITDGKTYAIEHAGQLRVKLLYRLPGGGIRIRSINRDEHPDEEYSQAQVEEQEIKVIGRVFWGAMYF